MYKDKDKQREANAERQRRYRANRGFKAYPKGVTNNGRYKEGVTDGSIPIETLAEMDSGCGDKLSHGLEPERTAQGNIRVSKPGDVDYVSESGSESGFDDETSAERQNKGPSLSGSSSGTIETSSPGKRGKDIKCFEDLPADVQLSIDLMDIGPEEKKRRTGIAVNYQHQFPDRYHSTGVV